MSLQTAWHWRRRRGGGRREVEEKEQEDIVSAATTCTRSTAPHSSPYSIRDSQVSKSATRNLSSRAVQPSRAIGRGRLAHPRIPFVGGNPLLSVQLCNSVCREPCLHKVSGSRSSCLSVTSAQGTSSVAGITSSRYLASGQLHLETGTRRLGLVLNSGRDSEQVQRRLSGRFMCDVAWSVWERQGPRTVRGRG